MRGGSHGERVQRSRIQPTSYMWVERSLPYNARLSGIALHAATSGLHRVRIFNRFFNSLAASRGACGGSWAVENKHACGCACMCGRVKHEAFTNGAFSLLEFGFLFNIINCVPNLENNFENH